MIDLSWSADPPPPLAPVRRIDHFGLSVADLDRSLHFYRDLLGLGVISISESEPVGAIVDIPGARARIADLDAGEGQVIELLSYAAVSGPDPPAAVDAPGTCHLALEVTDLPGALERLAAAGHPPVGETATLSSGWPWNGCTVVYVRDPDGVIVELVARDRRPPDGAAG